MGDLNELVERLQKSAQPSEFRRANPTLSDSALAMRYSFDAALKIEAAAALTSLMAERDGLREALKPFAMQGWADENGWTDRGCPNDRICDWFGPSDFRRARTALSLDTNKGDGENG